MSYRFKENEIILLLGAGASVEAGIPHSNDMIRQLESLVRGSEKDWNVLHDLYFYIRGTFEYGNALRKINNASYLGINYNIESLYVALDELSKRDEHLLFPFIGAWNPKLADVAGSKFENVKKLKQKIFEKIRHWVGKTQSEDVEYYENIFEFRKEYESTLRIFSMNYDLCVEKAWKNWSSRNKDDEIDLLRGFHAASKGEKDKSRSWDWKLLDEYQSNFESQPVFLYKLHGSIDWKKEGEKTKFQDEDSWSNIKLEDSVFIFGETNKLHYNDPFFFLFQEFRKWALSSKLIISIGYSFGDEHINNVIRQSLVASPSRKLLVISPYFNKEGISSNEDDGIELSDGSEPSDKYLGDLRQNKIDDVCKTLKIEQLCRPQVAYWFYGAKAFMTNQLKIENLAKLFDEDEEEIIEETEIE